MKLAPAGLLLGLTVSVSLPAQSPPARSASPRSASPRAAAARTLPPAQLPAEWVSKFQWRSIGPANMGGRIVALSVYEKDPKVFFVATASGGLLKTVNNGISFEHQFDKETTVSIGDVCVAPSNPNIVWVGTGEENPRNSVSYGDGVYKSVDGGKTWKNMGLQKTFQIGSVVVHPTNPDIVYVGALGRLYGPNPERGLFKTTDGGETWDKIHFVDDKTGVIDIQMHPTEHDTLIFATYERQRDGFDGNSPEKTIAPGSGLWRTTDGGMTFEKLTEGLPTCQLGRIGIDYYRKNPNIVYAIIESEMMGKPGANVGWSGITATDAEAGAKVSGLADKSPGSLAGLEPGDIILRLNEETVLSGSKLIQAMTKFEVGEKVALEVVRDGKSSKRELTLAAQPSAAPSAGSGQGRRGGTRPRGISSIRFAGRLRGQGANLQDFQGKNGFEHGGVFRSDDGGSSWRRINSIDPRPMYFSQLRVDPSDNKYLYVLGISASRSVDGGKTFTADAGRGVHADQHALWIDPKDGNHMILGCDGGIYATYDRTKVWMHLNHNALGQFYHVAVGPRRDYWVYGGLQDNGTWGAPHRGANGSGPVNEDWIRIGGGDGFVVAVDRIDPDLIYFESQNGATRRTHLVTGEGGTIRPGSASRGGAQRGGGQRGAGQRGGAERGASSPRVRYRYNWRTPFILSSHNTRIYYNAGNYVFRSLDRGNDLRAISPEITRTDRGSGTAIAESPRDPNVLYAGTDDGGLWGTQHGDHDWVDLRKVEASGEPSDDATKNRGPRVANKAKRDARDGAPFTDIVPKPMWISSIEASRYATGRVYVTVDGHRSDDDDPYVLVSEDFGQSWKSLRANLPRGSTRVIREDRVNQDLLYLGTEFGLYISLDRGASWVRFHNNLPTVAVHEIAQHDSCGDVVLATHGRSLWSLDVSPLRQMTRSAMAEALLVCQPSDVVLWRRGRGRGATTGAVQFVGQTPSARAAICFVTKRKPRALSVQIQDLTGKVLRNLEAEPAAGLTRLTWDLRSDPPPGSATPDPSRFRGGFRGGRFGRSASPGKYQVVVTADGVTKSAEFEVVADPR